MQERLARVYRLFPRLQERERQIAGSLSGGEQQMLAIGRGLMSSPQLLLLDEPSIGLAPNLVREILELLARLRDEGLTVLAGGTGCPRRAAHRRSRLCHGDGAHRGRRHCQAAARLAQMRRAYLGMA